jgi:hypothetical protein
MSASRPCMNHPSALRSASTACAVGVDWSWRRLRCFSISPIVFGPSETIDFEIVLLLETAHHRDGLGTIDAIILQRRLGAEFVERLLDPQDAVGDVIVLLKRVARRIGTRCSGPWTQAS